MKTYTKPKSQNRNVGFHNWNWKIKELIFSQSISTQSSIPLTEWGICIAIGRIYLVPKMSMLPSYKKIPFSQITFFHIAIELLTLKNQYLKNSERFGDNSKNESINFFQKYYQSYTFCSNGTKLISTMRSIDLACLDFHLATRYCKSVFYTALLQYILPKCMVKEKHFYWKLFF